MRQLEAVVKLSRDNEFQEQRRVVHQWQEEVIARGMGDEDAVNEMGRAVHDYARYMERKVRTGRWKFAYIAITAGLAAGLGLAAAVAPPLVIPATLLSLSPVAQVIAFERSDPAGPGQSAVAAMFYEARRARSTTSHESTGEVDGPLGSDCRRCVALATQRLRSGADGIGRERRPARSGTRRGSAQGSSGLRGSRRAG